MALIAFDSGRALSSMPHGSGIYVRRLWEALRAAPSGHELWAPHPARFGPEVWWEQVALPRAARRRGAALLHAPDTFLPLRRSCPGVVTIHDLGFEAVPDEIGGLTGRKYRALAPRAARSAERVICPSRFTADDVIRRYRVDPERVRVIPEAPALPVGEARPEAAMEADPVLLDHADPYLLAVGDLRPKKNLARLIEAFRLLRAEGLSHRLILAGADIGLAAQLREAAGTAPVELSGFITDRALDALIRGADAVVVPSFYEGFGLIALDAMARGRPVMLARAGALPETGGDAAAYFDPFDSRGLAAVIDRVVSDRGEHARLAAAGRAHAATFTWERAAEQTLAVYEELL